MPNTTNYSFPTPADTDLVKNGADAIRDLGDAVDTAMNTALGTKKSGLVLLNTTSFSGAVSFALAQDTFTTTYDNYRMLINLTSASFSGLTLRMRAAGSDATGADYNYQIVNASGSAISASRSTGQTSTLIGYGRTEPSYFIIELMAPKLAQRTRIISLENDYAGGTALEQQNSYSFHDLSTAYDSLSITSSGNLSGTYSVYGYNK